MQKKIITILLFISLLAVLSCNKYSLTDSEIPETTSDLTKDNISTKLAVVNIEVVGSEFEQMYSNYSQDIEITAYINMYENGETILPRTKAKISIKGSSTIHYPLKSLKIKFSDKIDNTIYPIIKVEKHISTHHLKYLKKVSLRNFGNDLYGSLIKDVCYTQMAIDLGLQVELNYYRPVQVFVNNKYYGLLNLRTEKGKLGISELLEVDKNDLNIMKINHIGGNEENIEFIDGDDEILQALLDAANNSDTDKLKELIDIESFIDYLVYEDYIGNSDWPYNNIEIFNVGEKGKFRFYLYDLDFSGNRDKYFASDANKASFLYKLFNALRQDEQIEKSLLQRQRDMYNFCHRDRFEAIINKNANLIEDEVIYNISKYNVPESRIHWYYELDGLGDQQQLRRENYKKEYDL